MLFVYSIVEAATQQNANETKGEEAVLIIMIVLIIIVFVGYALSGGGGIHDDITGNTR